jgi:chorismate mutase
MTIRTDRVRAIGVFKARTGLTPADIQARAAKMVEAVKALPLMQENLLKYEVVSPISFYPIPTI